MTTGEGACVMTETEKESGREPEAASGTTGVQERGVAWSFYLVMFLLALAFIYGVCIQER